MSVSLVTKKKRCKKTRDKECFDVQYFDVVHFTGFGIEFGAIKRKITLRRDQ